MQLEDPCTNLRDSVDAAPHAEENESPSTKNRADSIMDISSDESKSPINKCKSNCRKKKVKTPWTPEEDAVLLKLVADEGHSVKWAKISSKINIKRTGKQCRERYHNHLRPNIRKGDWTHDEDKTLVQLKRKYGNQWAKIAKHLPGRSDNTIKNRWHLILRGKNAEAISLSSVDLSATGGAEEPVAAVPPPVPAIAVSAFEMPQETKSQSQIESEKAPEEGEKRHVEVEETVCPSVAETDGLPYEFYYGHSANEHLEEEELVITMSLLFITEEDATSNRVDCSSVSAESSVPSSSSLLLSSSLSSSSLSSLSGFNNSRDCNWTEMDDIERAKRRPRSVAAGAVEGAWKDQDLPLPLPHPTATDKDKDEGKDKGREGCSEAPSDSLPLLPLPPARDSICPTPLSVSVSQEPELGQGAGLSLLLPLSCPSDEAWQDGQAGVSSPALLPVSPLTLAPSSELAFSDTLPRKSKLRPTIMDRQMEQREWWERASLLLLKLQSSTANDSSDCEKPLIILPTRRKSVRLSPRDRPALSRPAKKTRGIKC